MIGENARGRRSLTPRIDWEIQKKNRKAGKNEMTSGRRGRSGPELAEPSFSNQVKVRKGLFKSWNLEPGTKLYPGLI